MATVGPEVIAVWFLVFAACSGGDDRAEAQAALEAALETREVPRVAEAAKVAAAWEGQDPVLDHLIGDALANVLMKPAEGLPLLTAQPAEGDAAWERAVLGASLRDGSAEALKDWPLRFGRDLPAHPVVQQLSVAARRDPSVGWETVEAAYTACHLLDLSPTRGRRPADGPVPAGILDAARVLGADLVVVGRPDYITDPDPILGEAPWRCMRHRWMEAGVLPELIVKNVILGASRGEERLWLWVGPGLDRPEAIAASDEAGGERWLAAARLLEELGGGAEAEARVRAELGLGLLAPEGAEAAGDTPPPAEGSTGEG